MNQFTLNYTLNRVKQIESEKLSKVKKKLLKPGKMLSSEERYKLLKLNKVKIKSTVSRVKDYNNIEDVFDFSPFEYEESYDEIAYEKSREKIVKTAQKVRDELVLGDETEALKLLQSFEKLNV